jgi:imidazolonepropionase-like amidohydrolase
MNRAALATDNRLGGILAVLAGCASFANAQVAVRGETVYTMAGAPISNGVVVITDGKIAAVGPAAQVQIPDGHQVLDAKVVTPGLIDAHATVGLTGIYNEDHDQDQLESSKPIQPELRAIDAYNTRERLVDWIRGYGITTVHTGHAPGELISGQTTICKTIGNTIEDAVIVPSAAVACTLSSSARKGEDKSPGTRAKMIAMLRAAFVEAQGYLEKQEHAAQEDEGDGKDDAKQTKRDLKLETLGRVLNKELPLLVTANRAQDIASALRLAREFDIRLWLDGCAEGYLLIDEIKAAGVPVFIHPTMERTWGDSENLSFETAAKLREAGIPVALQSSYEDYVPKVRVVLFEAAIAATNGLGPDAALATITLDAAKILGIADRVGSLEIGKDGDVALYDGDPFEYTTHCVGVVINGQVVSDAPQ